MNLEEKMFHENDQIPDGLQNYLRDRKLRKELTQGDAPHYSPKLLKDNFIINIVRYRL